MKKILQQAVLAPAVFALLLSLFSPDAFAYLDPSTGSMVVTAIVGLFASLALAVKTYWYKLKNLLRRANRRATAVGKDSPVEE